MFTFSVVSLLIIGTTGSVLMLLLPFYLQDVLHQSPSFMQTVPHGRVTYGFGLTPTQVGLYLLPGGVLGFVAGPAAGRLGTRYGSRLPLITGEVMSMLTPPTVAGEAALPASSTQLPLFVSD